jgi:hypothetical protein
MNRIDLILLLVALSAGLALAFTPDKSSGLSQEAGILNGISCQKVGKSEGRDLISVKVNSIEASLNSVNLYPCEKHRKELESLVGKHVKLLYQHSTLWSLQSNGKEYIQLNVLTQNTKTGWLVLLAISATIYGVRRVKKT